MKEKQYVSNNARLMAEWDREKKNKARFRCCKQRREVADRGIDRRTGFVV